MNNLTKKIIKFATTGMILFIANFANGQYQVLADLPKAKAGDTVQIIPYINNLYNMIFASAAVLAVLMIVVGGFLYLSSDAISNKSSGKEKIQGAVTGLIIILGAYLLLNTVNPDILKSNNLINNAPLGFYKSVPQLIKEDIVKTYNSLISPSAREWGKLADLYGKSPVGGTLEDIQRYNIGRDEVLIKDARTKLDALQKFNFYPEQVEKLKRAIELKNKTTLKGSEILELQRLDTYLEKNNLPKQVGILQTKLIELEDEIEPIKEEKERLDVALAEKNISIDSLQSIVEKDDLFLAQKKLEISGYVGILDFKKSNSTNAQTAINDLDRLSFQPYENQVVTLLNGPSTQHDKETVIKVLKKQYERRNKFIDDICALSTGCLIRGYKKSDSEITRIINGYESKYLTSAP